MRQLIRLTQLLLLSGVSLGPGFAHATLSAHLQRGEKVVDLSVPGRNAEVCVIPKHFVGGEYSDEDIEVETKLCNIDENKNAAVCPKLNSTNPGLDFYSLPQGDTPDKVEGARCETASAKKIAKYKLSTSCSYTPSILGYYHVSRMLGAIGDVPPTVLRTFDLNNHIALGHKALDQTKSGTLIHQTWVGLMAQLTAGAKGNRRDFLLTDDFAQSYGALSEKILRKKISTKNSSMVVQIMLPVRRSFATRIRSSGCWPATRISVCSWDETSRLKMPRRWHSSKMLRT